MPSMRGGIGGTGAPAMNGGIGGTGLRPESKADKNALAGKILFVLGKVEAIHLGKTRLLTKGASVRVGDTLKSGEGATVQLRMEDGGTIVLRPESQLAIESFVYNKAHDDNEHMALALLSGGFRAVTGEIGHLHKENYLIRTPNAQIGILGTDHETVFIPVPTSGQTSVIEPGTYNHVISGGTVLKDALGNVMIKPNQTGFASLNGTIPVLIGSPLPIFGELIINFGTTHHTHGSSAESKKNNSNATKILNSNSSADVTASKLSETPTSSKQLEKGNSPILPQNLKSGSIKNEVELPAGTLIHGK